MQGISKKPVNVIYNCHKTPLRIGAVTVPLCSAYKRCNIPKTGSPKNFPTASKARFLQIECGGRPCCALPPVTLPSSTLGWCPQPVALLSSTSFPLAWAGTWAGPVLLGFLGAALGLAGCSISSEKNGRGSPKVVTPQRETIGSSPRNFGSTHLQRCLTVPNLRCLNHGFVRPADHSLVHRN